LHIVVPFLCGKSKVTATMLIGEVIVAHRQGHDHMVVGINKHAPACWVSPSRVAQRDPRFILAQRKGEVTATMLTVEVVLVHVLEAVTGRTGHDLTIMDLN